MKRIARTPQAIRYLTTIRMNRLQSVFELHDRMQAHLTDLLMLTTLLSTRIGSVREPSPPDHRHHALRIAEAGGGAAGGDFVDAFEILFR